ncbi:hypothetical protein [Pantoea sp. AS-PWVM4]|uniref:hypothetical protein n=1 Tax=Pantoea sp. AS-PWVM4 TaxID=1332069 RepID=UPI001267A162|nr:hypothetical protein [Pantoea sp. AS-PWVM4]
MTNHAATNRVPGVSTRDKSRRYQPCSWRINARQIPPLPTVLLAYQSVINHAATNRAPGVPTRDKSRRYQPCSWRIKA